MVRRRVDHILAVDRAAPRHDHRLVARNGADQTFTPKPGITNLVIGAYTVTEGSVSADTITQIRVYGTDDNAILDVAIARLSVWKDVNGNNIKDFKVIFLKRIMSKIHNHNNILILPYLINLVK